MMRNVTASACIALILLCMQTGYGQLEIRKDRSSEDLILQIFAGNSGKIRNITHTPDSAGIAYFSSVNTNLALDSGIILCTGDAASATGPNKSEKTSKANLRRGDDYLTAHLRYNTSDACVIEFDFFAYTDRISFIYVFASEEYPEWVNSKYNDAFAFIIFGEGFTDKGKNIAIVPDTTQDVYVAINEINQHLKQKYYVDNGNGQTIEYDGFTTPLVATTTLTPCKYYHLKLVIADASDGLWDSAVFLKGGSFETGSISSVDNGKPAYEGCSPGGFYVKRVGSLLQPAVVQYKISGTAQPGIDYKDIPTEVVLEAGVSQVFVPIEAYEDGIDESGEYITITNTVLTANCGLLTDSAVVYLHDAPRVSISGNREVCIGGEVRLTASVRKTYGRVSYRWTPNDSKIAILSDKPSLSTMYTVTITDEFSGCTAKDSFRVLIKSGLDFSIEGKEILCPGEQTTLTVRVPDSLGFYSYDWKPGGSRLPWQTVAPDRTTTYYVTVKDLVYACADMDSFRVRIDDLTADAGPDKLICRGDSVLLDGLGGLNGIPPYTYHWKPAYGLSAYNIPQPYASPRTPVQYSLTVTDANGCTASDTVIVNYSYPVLAMPHDTIVCKTTPVYIRTVASMGAPPYSFSWYPPDRVTDPHAASTFLLPDTSRSFILTVTDSAGCTISDTLNLTVSPPLTAIAGKDTNACTGVTVQLDGQVKGGIPPYRYQWSPANRLSNPDIPNPVFTAVWSQMLILNVTDAFGCRASDTMLVRVTNPLIVNACNDTVICPGTYAALFVQPKGGRPPLRFEWNPPESLDDPFSAVPHAYPSHSVVYRCTVRDALGCVSEDSVSVRVHPKVVPAISLAGSSRFCNGDSVALRIEGDFTRVRWSTADTARSITVKSGGSFWCRAWTGSGCETISDTITLEVDPSPELIVSGPEEVCVNSIADYTFEPLPGYISANWSVTGGTVLSESTTSIEVQWHTPGVGAVEVTITDQLTGCSGAGRVAVLVSDSLEPAILYSGDSLPCAGQTVTLSTDKHYDYCLWSTGDTTAAIEVTGDGMYSVFVRDRNGCAGTSRPLALTFRKIQLPLPSIAGDSVFCPDDTIIIHAPPGYVRYRWSTGDTTAFIAVADEGQYSVTVEDSSGCIATSPPRTMAYSTIDPPEIIMNGDSVLCQGETVVLKTGIDYHEYRWSTGETTPSITVSESGVYSVAVRTAESCEAESNPVAIRVVPHPAPVIAGSDTSCALSSAHYTAEGEAGSWFDWRITGGRLLNGNGTPLVDVEWADTTSGTIEVTETTVDGCIGSGILSRVYLRPRLSPKLILRGDTLDAGEWEAYVWLRNDTVIADAGGRFLYVTAAAIYSVIVTAPNGCTGRSEAVMYPQSILTVVQLPDIHSRPGERVVIPVRFVSSSVNLQDFARSYTGILRLDASILGPSEMTPQGDIVDGWRYVPFSGSWAPGKDTLGLLEFISTLGKTDTSTLSLERFFWNNPHIDVTTIGGSVTIEVCEEGGKRLFDDRGALRLEQNNPNPYNATTEIEFELIESGYTTLIVYDLLGREAAALVRESMQPGSYRIVFDASALASGTYIYALCTPTARLVRTMRVLK